MPKFGGSTVIENMNVEHLEYIDDGYSGKDFNQPAIQRLITDCRKGKVSCILVKDLSRLGRDYVEVSSYLENVFPFLHVRFIYVGENYDSGEECSCELSMDVQFSNMVNTYYLKDIAIKSAAGRVAKWKRGELASTRTPIGYVCENVKDGWKVDEEGADIVRMFFDLALSGLGTGAIATEMNKMGIPTPYRYLKSKGYWRGCTFKSVEEKMVWDASSVYMILMNEAYIQGTVSRDKYKAFQDEVKVKIEALQNGIAVTRGEDALLEEVEEKLKPLADGSVAAEKSGLSQAMVQELVANVWGGEEITVEFKADSVMRTLEDELVG